MIKPRLKKEDELVNKAAKPPGFAFIWLYLDYSLLNQNPNSRSTLDGCNEL